MYEDKRRKLKINWKSLIIKMLILLVVVFLVMWLFSLITKSNKKASNIGENLKIMQSAASEYFTGERLPEKLNGKETLTLADMISSKLIVEFKDQNGKACEKEDSYAEATKISDNEYTIKVKLVCGNENDYIINTIKVDNQLVDNNEIEEPNIDENNNDVNSDNNDNVVADNNSNNNSTSNNNSSTNKQPNTNKKPNITYVTSDKNNNSSTNSNSSTNTNTNTNSNTNSSNSNNTTNTCQYGNTEYSATYPAAYLISGNCAISKDAYLNSDYTNTVNDIGSKEYQKLYNEMISLGSSTGTTLSVSAPSYSPVYNKANTGIVGYQIMFTVKQKITYTTKTIYQYYLDTNGNRKVVIDNRASLYNLNNNGTSGSTGSSNTGSSTGSDNTGSSSGSGSTTKPNVNVQSLTLDTQLVRLAVGGSYSLRATINPANATNKTINWSSNNTRVATVSNTGLITAKGIGSATIIASVGNVKAEVLVIVQEEFLEPEVEVVNLKIGKTFMFNVNTNMTGYKTYTSNNTNVATVSNTGLITARGEGVAMITVTINGKKAAMLVSVRAEDYLDVTSDQNIHMFVGNDLQIFLSTNIDTRYITYTSSKPNIARVSSTGKITAVSNGMTVITIRSGNIVRKINVYVYKN